METDPVPETSCFLVSRVSDDGKSPKTMQFRTMRSVFHGLAGKIYLIWYFISSSVPSENNQASYGSHICPYKPPYRSTCSIFSNSFWRTVNKNCPAFQIFDHTDAWETVVINLIFHARIFHKMLHMCCLSSTWETSTKPYRSLPILNCVSQ
jgi:hypothetical protein